MGYKRPAVRPSLQALSGYHSPQLDVEVRLNTNESPEPPPPGFDEAFAQALKAQRWNRYPDREAIALREKIGKRHGRSSSEVFVANGSNEVLQTLLMAWAGPGRKVATFAPTYAMHTQIARVLGSEIVEIERDENFVIDLAAGLDILRREQPVITFLCSPNNPTGLVEPREVVEAVAACVKDFGLLVVDEAYAEFSDWSCAELVSDDSPIVVSRTFSKTWAMAAARLGYLLAPEWVVEKASIAVLPYHLNALSQQAGLIALDFEEDMQRRTREIVEQRDALISDLKSLGLQVWDSESNFVLFRPNEGQLDGVEIWNQLVQRSILIRNCATWPGLEGCLRVSIGTASENRRFVKELTEILK